MSLGLRDQLAAAAATVVGGLPLNCLLSTCLEEQYCHAHFSSDDTEVTPVIHFSYYWRPSVLRLVQTTVSWKDVSKKKREMHYRLLLFLIN